MRRLTFDRMRAVSSCNSLRRLVYSASLICLGGVWCGDALRAADSVQLPFDSHSHRRFAKPSFHVVFKRSDPVPGSRDISIVVELASTQQEIIRGLMFRKHLDENQGMLFLFDSEQPLGFWMKNTLISLDIIFINQDLKIVSFHTRVPPCRRDPCPVYKSGKPAKYVVEVNAGFVEKYDIFTGDRVEIKRVSNTVSSP